MDDIVNQIASFADTEEDQGQIDLNQYGQSQQEYTAKDEYQSRKNASDFVRTEIQKQMLNKNKEEERYKKYDEVIAQLKNELAEVKANHGKIAKDVNYTTDQTISKQIISEENELKSDPILGRYVNIEELRKFYNGEAEKGRYYTPKEAAYILYAPTIAAKLAEVEKSTEIARAFRNAPINGGTQNSNIDRLSNVNSIDDAYAESMRRASEMGLF